ncbi:class IIb bacteriocin, lactobin A/cerein 7B family [Phormidium sp. FACHB-592]|uniref:Class IIb bacteriocin, lactobin A/cerein 7B family n=1 Tax=Stenomitos frigidus AS-A4 TaxID=2933935 RepID=A0ABV0KVB4_9CYAN|nr:class IIb bacteriocin, lactobin A/cerein 7B family [Phormidium sp. FACHB-592]MBD2077177.1 class IIb bacteriocin, lactobin A/cerein 7B family [Phormidium sp. FACHB-592]
MSFEFESVNHCRSDTSGLNITSSHLLEDEDGLSDDELEQVSGGIAPLILVGAAARIAAPFVLRTAAKVVAKAASVEFGQGFAEGLRE